MIDPRLEMLAKNVVNHSVELKRGENVLINCIGDGLSLAKQFVKEVYKVGGRPFVKLENQEIERLIKQDCTEEQIDILAKAELMLMKEMDVYIGIGARVNTSEMSSVKSEVFTLAPMPI